jgi:hypothetical protein
MKWSIFGMNRVRATGAWAAGGICMASALVGVTPDCRAQPCEQSSWTPVAHQPVANSVGQVAYDSDRGVLVWLNGTGTWESANGDIWSLRAESGPRNGGQIVYDEARHVCILFGGFNYFGPDETWQWDGSTWTFLTNQGPSPRAAPSLAYDSTNQRVLLFGGEADAVHFNDTWAWSGSTWELIDSSLATPPPRSRAALSYDPQRGKMVLFGG